MIWPSGNGIQTNPSLWKKRIPLNLRKLRLFPIRSEALMVCSMIPLNTAVQYWWRNHSIRFDQDPGEGQMQFEVIDDGSTDAYLNPLLQKLGKGRVRYFRQPEKGRSLRNFWNLSESGDRSITFMFCHEDDKVRNGFLCRRWKISSQLVPQAALHLPVHFCWWAKSTAVRQQRLLDEPGLIKKLAVWNCRFTARQPTCLVDEKICIGKAGQLLCGCTMWGLGNCGYELLQLCG